MDCFTCGADRQAASSELLSVSTLVIGSWSDSTICDDRLTRSWKQTPEPAHRTRGSRRKSFTGLRIFGLKLQLST